MKKYIFALAALLYATVPFAQNAYAKDRVYAANQVSNSVSVIEPSDNRLLGEIKLGNPYPNALSPLYRGQALVHGLRYSAQRKMLAVVSIGSNAVTLISTETNKILKTIYVGRSPHEPTFTPDNKQIWTTVRGEAYISIIDADQLKEIRQVPVADGPGMVSFSPDGKTAFICSSFTPELDIVNTGTYQVIKRIPVASPFSPNIYTSPDGKWVAMTHKDVGKITVLNTSTLTIEKVINSGPITNHVTFSKINNKLLMLATIGGENKIKVYDVSTGFELIKTLDVGASPHGIWPSADGKIVFIGLEYGDQVQKIDMVNMQLISTVKIGQSPQALVYADNAVSEAANHENLVPLNDSTSSKVIVLNSVNKDEMAHGRLVVRSIGLTDLIEQAFVSLIPGNAYTLYFSKSGAAPFSADYEVNSFTADANGKYMGQVTGLIKSTSEKNENKYLHIILMDSHTKLVILTD